ncbi:MAG: TauD/TfdA family dioxygenase [Parachlamydiaceae bacterium]|nr:TauD/TfdA family dioxygenase [Parachlamydiaceae bacterium]
MNLVTHNSNTELMKYERKLASIALLQRLGPFNVKVVGQDFIERSFLEKIKLYTSAFLSIFKKQIYFETSMQENLNLAKKKIEEINTIHSTVSIDSPNAKVYFNARQIVDTWNKNFGIQNNLIGKIQNWLLSKIDSQWKNAPLISYEGTINVNPSEVLEKFFSFSLVNYQKKPLVIEPKEEKITLEAFHKIAEEHREAFKELLNKYGAILLRGFPVINPDDFSAILKSVLNRSSVDYVGGEGSRTKIKSGVYTSTEAPQQYTIPLHNELSCTIDDFPKYISFACFTAPAPGTGQTLLGDSKEISEIILGQKQFADLKDKTVLHISRHGTEGNFFNKVNITHKTFQSSFGTDNKEEINNICAKKKFIPKWTDEYLEVKRRTPCTRPNPNHPDQTLWFNQIHLYHANPKIRGGWLNHILANLLYCREKTRQYDVFFEDGTPIPRKLVYELYRIYEEKAIRFDWKKGDVLILDNIEVMHGRASYNGPRKILASLIP